MSPQKRPRFQVLLALEPVHLGVDFVNEWTKTVRSMELCGCSNSKPPICRMVYTTHLWWLGGRFSIAIPTLPPFNEQRENPGSKSRTSSSPPKKKTICTHVQKFRPLVILVWPALQWWHRHRPWKLPLFIQHILPTAGTRVNQTWKCKILICRQFADAVFSHSNIRLVVGVSNLPCLIFRVYITYNPIINLPLINIVKIISPFATQDKSFLKQALANI